MAAPLLSVSETQAETYLEQQVRYPSPSATQNISKVAKSAYGQSALQLRIFTEYSTLH